jgi:membrane protein YqaA with SNARE-associated domain
LLRAYVVRTKIVLAVSGIASQPGYPLIVGGIAFAMTLSMLMPFVPVLIGTVLVRREQWVAIVFVSSLGSAAGGLILYVAFHHLGWNQVVEAYPDLLQTAAWIDATWWLSAYGTWALFLIAASPFAQTPALLLAAVSDLAIQDVFVALLLGKFIKYGLYGWTASKFPAWFHHYAPSYGQSNAIEVVPKRQLLGLAGYRRAGK